MEHDFSRKDNREGQRDNANPYPNSTCTCLVVALVVVFPPCPSRPLLKPSAETACLAASAFTLKNYGTFAAFLSAVQLTLKLIS